jgi:hypothetical protein
MTVTQTGRPLDVPGSLRRNVDPYYRFTIRVVGKMNCTGITTSRNMVYILLKPSRLYGITVLGLILHHHTEDKRWKEALP